MRVFSGSVLKKKKKREMSAQEVIHFSQDGDNITATVHAATRGLLGIRHICKKKLKRYFTSVYTQPGTNDRHIA